MAVTIDLDVLLKNINTIEATTPEAERFDKLKGIYLKIKERTDKICTCGGERSMSVINAEGKICTFCEKPIVD